MRDINEILKYTKPLTLLYVEDNREMLLRNEELFLDYFREVVCVSNAAEALNRYKQRKEQTGDYFDIVISDIEMPRVNGIELCRRLLAENINQKLIALSAHNEPQYLFELINMGISSFLLKPITIQALCESLYTTAKSIYDERMIRFRSHQVTILNQNLKAKISELNTALIEGHNAAKKKDLYLANITREIRTPLNTVIDLVEELMQTPLSETQNGYLSRIRRSVHQTLGITNDILNISEIESGMIPLDSIHFNLNDLLALLADKIALLTFNKNLDVAFDIAKEVPIRFIGDPRRLEQILFHLLENAVKFTPDGSIRLKIGIRGSEETTRIVEFDIIDSGVGMNSAQCLKVFEPFARNEPVFKQQPHSTGLGLNLTQKMLNSMGGEISVRSALGKGSTFSIKVPLALSNPQERRLYRLPHASMMGKSVLIIDAHAFFAESLAQKLHYFHCEVTTHANCSNIPLGHYPYDIIMIDYAQLENLKAILPPSMTSTKLVLLGNDTGFTPSDPNFPLPIDGSLSKPCTQQMLFELLLKLYDDNGTDINHIHLLKGKESLLPLKGSRILIAVNNATIRKTLLNALENTGIEILTASNGLEALKLLDQREADLLLIEMYMPIMGGFQTAATIRSQPKLDDLPIIALTEEASRSDSDAFSGAGIQGYLAKPYEADALYTLLTRFIKPKKSRRSDLQRNA